MKVSEPEDNEPKTLEEVDEAVSEDDSDDGEGEPDVSEQKSKRFEDMHSDTVNMVMDLFDGKVIE